VKRAWILLLAGCATAPRDPIADGAAFLVRDQQPNGSWGRGARTTPWDLADDVPGAHHAFRDATTALAVMALREAAPNDPAAVAARQRGVEFLTTKADARRSSTGQLYNVWAHVYMTHALANELRYEPDNAAVRDACARQVRLLEIFQTYMGGWQYYDNSPATHPSNLDPTSFTTAAGLVALWDARQVGVVVPQPMVDHAIKRVHQSRNPDGSYCYGFDGRLRPMSSFNQMKGSIGRNQSCNDALWLWGVLGPDEARRGLDEFFTHHKFIFIGRKRQNPHEAWYATAPYYYYFGHYYAGRLVGRLDDAALRAKYRATILPYQESNGSWWDYPMWDYHEPYGTALALLGLVAAGD
jgi:hypothetical protein